MGVLLNIYIYNFIIIKWGRHGINLILLSCQICPCPVTSLKKNNPSIGIKIGLHNTSDDFGSKKPTDQFFGWFHCLWTWPFLSVFNTAMLIMLAPKQDSSLTPQALAQSTKLLRTLGSNECELNKGETNQTPLNLNEFPRSFSLSLIFSWWICPPWMATDLLSPPAPTHRPPSKVLWGHPAPLWDFWPGKDGGRTWETSEIPLYIIYIYGNFMIRQSNEITLLRATPTVTLFCHSFWHLIWKYIWHIFADILFS